MDLSIMLDKIINYKRLFEKFGFISNDKYGIKPWSVRHEGKNYNIDHRNSEWTIYDKNDNELLVGYNLAQLEMWLNYNIGVENV